MAIDTKPPPTPVDGLVFVSYARENRNDVEPWRESLATATRANVWWDNDITPGERWRSEILDRLSDASCVVLFWSRHAKESDFINEVEVPEALKRDILVLATIDDAPLTEELGEMQAAVLHNDETGNEWDKLTGAISDMLTSGSTGATQSPA